MSPASQPDLLAFADRCSLNPSTWLRESAFVTCARTRSNYGALVSGTLLTKDAFFLYKQCCCLCLRPETAVMTCSLFLSCKATSNYRRKAQWHAGKGLSFHDTCMVSPIATTKRIAAIKAKQELPELSAFVVHGMAVPYMSA